MIRQIEPEENQPNLEALNAAARKLADQHNHTPDPEIGGLTPDSLWRLNHHAWDTPECPLKLQKALPLEAFAAAPFFVGMRNLLLYAEEKGGLGCTAKGNLSRSVVNDALDMFLSEEEKDLLDDTKKVRKTAFYDQWIRFEV